MFNRNHKYNFFPRLHSYRHTENYYTIKFHYRHDVFFNHKCYRWFLFRPAQTCHNLWCYIILCVSSEQKRKYDFLTVFTILFPMFPLSYRCALIVKILSPRNMCLFNMNLRQNGEPFTKIKNIEFFKCSYCFLAILILNVTMINFPINCLFPGRYGKFCQKNGWNNGT